jgi:protein-S-isoprenylcysteine O-methyltransferase Ste14
VWSEEKKMKISTQAWIGLAQFQIVMALLLFLPAGTLRYWQGWVYWSLCLLAFGGITLDLIRNAPDLLARRMKIGAQAETRSAQKTIQAITSVLFIALFLVSALDYRWNRTAVPPSIVLIGDITVVIGCGIIHRVFRANRYTAATVQVEAEQTLTDTGPYAVVRHPMYAGALLLLFGTPLALGSLKGLLVSLLLFLAIIVRLLDEERLLVQDLPGYLAYKTRVRFRLIPGIW